MRLLKAIAIIVAAAALLAAGMVAYVATLDAKDVTAMVVQVVRDATGRELEIAGPVELSVFPAIKLTAEDVRFANASWGTEPDMARAARVEVSIRLLPLLTRRIWIRQIALDSPSLLVETREDGRGNWEFGNETGERRVGDRTLDWDVTLSTLAVRNAVFRYRVGDSGELRSVSLDELVLTENLILDRLNVRLSGTYRDRPMALEGQVGRLNNVLQNRPLALELDFQGLGAELQAEGEIARPLDLDGLALDVDARADSSQEIDEVFGVNAPTVTSASLRGRVFFNQGVWTFEDIESEFSALGGSYRMAGSLGDIEQYGDVDLEFEVEAPTIVVPREAMGLDIPHLEKVRNISVSGSLHGKGERVALEEFTLRAGLGEGSFRVSGTVSDALSYRGLRLDVELTDLSARVLAEMARIEWDGLDALGPLTATATLAQVDERLVLDQIEATAPAGTGTARVTGSVADVAAVDGFTLAITLDDVAGTSITRFAETEIPFLNAVTGIRATGNLTSASERYSLASLKATGAIEQGRLSANGAIGDLLNGRDLDLDLSFDGIPLSRVAELADLRDPGDVEVTDLRFQGKLREAGGRYSLETFEGFARFDGDPLRVRGKIGDLLKGRDVDVLVELESKDPVQLAKTLDADMPPIAYVKSVGRVRDTADGFAIRDLQATIRVEGGELDLAGDIPDVATLLGSKLDFTVEADRLSRFSELAGFELPPLGPVAVSGRMQSDASRYELGNLRAKVADNDLSGEAAVDISEPRPSITATLESRRIDVDELRRQIRGNRDPTTERPDPDRVFSAERLPFDALRTFDADIRIRADELIFDRAPMEQGEHHLVVKDGRLRLDTQSTLADGRFEGEVQIDASREPTAVSVGLDARKFSLGKLSREVRGFGWSSGGESNLRLRATGAGDSVRDIMAGLNGSLRYDSHGAVIDNPALDRAGADMFMQFMRFATPKSDAAGKTELDCAVMDLDAVDGEIRIDQTVAIETRKINAAVSGNVSLRDETLDLGAALKAREGIRLGAGGIARAIRLRGTFANPQVGADVGGVAATAGAAGATVAGAVFTGGLSLLGQAAFERFRGEPNPCEQVIAARSGPRTVAGSKAAVTARPKEADEPEAAASSAPEPGPDAEAEEGGATGLIRGFGRGIRELFGG